MAYLRCRALQQLHVQRSLRHFGTSSSYSKTMAKNSESNFADTAENSSATPKVCSDTPSTDQQSSASAEEHKSGDDHPAKQPDYQAQPTRSTGIGGDTEVKGGKEGLEER
ncbi:uncharacterized protein K460DRAFT_367483 [Cucurbitaria berberidis CBS 394.84]|uniref:Uncharacterized protein n=1 Tax=Cucurbitaria berberidis CBS 394.84 TaxID=1168544 RepID=A0A9P4L9T9_9PLEO|nr:uncharacterized protein K460DRAFT_367483 [Cucurbitaria berberidis CBS 394.84]KAF1846743.1 hypothetical protein K460DRAFT_367483 [Cucurbitaria berberidis CBS 394.84]